jgi:hypothetical protein
MELFNSLLLINRHVKNYLFIISGDIIHRALL